MYELLVGMNPQGFLEYDNGKILYTLKLEEDGFHRIKGIGD